MDIAERRAGPQAGDARRPLDRPSHRLLTAKYRTSQNRSAGMNAARSTLDLGRRSRKGSPQHVHSLGQNGTFLSTTLARDENTIKSVIVKMSTTQAVCDDLDRLLATGYFGKTRAEAAEQLLRAELLRRIEGESFDRLVDRKTPRRRKA